MFGNDLQTVSGSSGWAGAGLLSVVLGWLLFRHLPEKDRQVKELIDTHMAALRFRDECLATIGGNHVQVIDRVIDHCRGEARLEREAGERRFTQAMEMLTRIRDAQVIAGGASTIARKRED